MISPQRAASTFAQCWVPDLLRYSGKSILLHQNWLKIILLGLVRCRIKSRLPMNYFIIFKYTNQMLRAFKRALCINIYLYRFIQSVVVYTVYTPAAYMRRAADVMYQEKGTVCIMRCCGSHAASAAYCDPCRRPFECLARAVLSPPVESSIFLYTYMKTV